MGTNIDRKAYKELIQGDLDYLSKQTPGLEKDHIRQILIASIYFFYPQNIPNKATALDQENKPG